MDKLSSENKFAIMPEWVIELDISHTAFRLYAVLARYADNVTHQAFPSLETLSNRLGCGEKTVRRAIEDLVAHGAIKKHSRGRYQSSLYTVMTSAPEGSNMSSEGSNMSDEGTNMSTRLDKNDHLTRTTQLEPINENQLTNPFDIFWSIYPRRTGKQAAKASFEKAVKAVGLDKVMDGVRALAHDPNLPAEQFIPNPATWLNQGRWDDDPYPPKHVDRKPTAAERTAQLIHGARARDEQELITKGIGVGPDFGHMLKGIDG